MTLQYFKNMNNNRANNKRLATIKSDGKVRRKRRSRALKTRASDLPSRSRLAVYGDAGSQLARDLNNLRRFINTETHYTDALQNGQGMSTTATFTLLNGLTLGNTTTNRTGQSIRGVKSDFRFNMTGNALANAMQVRVLIVYDKQPNAAIFVIGDLLAATTPVSAYNFGNQNRFIILFDQSYSLSSLSGDFTMNGTSIVTTNQHVDYNTGNAGTIADITTGSMYLVQFSDQAVNTGAITFSHRYWFVDN